MDIIELTKTFAPYQFTDTTHEYTYYGEKVDISVTTLIASLTEQFNEAKWLPIKARQLKVSQANLKEQWTRKADIATTKGTAVHRYLENLQNGKKYEETFPEAESLGLTKEVTIEYNSLIPQCDRFYADSFGKLIPIKTELTVGLGTKIAGQIDLLAWNETKKEFQLLDYKTNKEIKTAGGYSNFKAPFNYLNDNELVHYSLQLGVYKEILKRNGFEVGDMWLVWFNKNNGSYKMYKCLDLHKECETILNNLEE